MVPLDVALTVDADLTFATDQISIANGEIDNVMRRSHANTVSSSRSLAS